MRSKASQPPTNPPSKLVRAALRLVQAHTQQRQAINGSEQPSRGDTDGLPAATTGSGLHRRAKEVEAIKRALEDLIATLEQLAQSEPDEELRQLAAQDLPQAIASQQSLQNHLASLVCPPNPTSSLSAILEVKAGVGGSESALFAAQLVRMYQKWAVRRGWKPVLTEVVGQAGVGQSGSASGGDAFREAILEVQGEGAFGTLKREAGVHRVQRVPATESQGRVHTSTVSIIVLPSESDTSMPEDDGLFDQKDVKVEVMRSRGAGGQNRAKAYRVLRARLMDRKLQAEIEARRSVRRSQVRGADRSEKVRTYNFPQDRVTDHRIPLTVSGLSDAIDGGETLDMISRELEIMEQEDALDELLES
ncbi:Peptide chain release factor 1, mitochondrial [Microbotryomycetes sp. JL201]|nr:Peptide chain release factor 1, mitochondrial [Microbotryomycetes sp. JL201]